MKRSRLRPRSKKRADERDERAAVRDAALLRDGGCVARWLGEQLGPCWGPLDVDEVCSRRRRPGGHLELANTIVLCRRHHDFKTDHDAYEGEAWRLGLCSASWEGDEGVEAARQRRLRWDRTAQLREVLARFADWGGARGAIG